MSTAAARTVSAMQLAVLDGRAADIGIVLGGLDAAELRDVAVELLSVWAEAVSFTGCTRSQLRAAVAADALAQAMGDGA